MGRNLHWIFELGFLCWNIESDELHVVFLGFLMYMLGRILWLLCYRMLPDSATRNMDAVWTMISNHYSRNKTPCQFTSLRLGSFCDLDKPNGAYPKLKGRGAEVKDLVHPIIEVWRHYMDGSARGDKLALEMLEGQADFQAMMSAHAKKPCSSR